MKISYNNILPALGILVFILLVSCETRLEIDLPDHDRKLVVNAIQLEDSTFVVHLSRSYGFQENISDEKLLVDDASVELWEGGNLLDKLVYRDTMVNSRWRWDPDWSADLLLGHYYSPKKLIVEKDKQYELRVDHPELGKAIGRMSLPKPIEPISIEFLLDTIKLTDIDGYVYYNSVLRVTLPSNVETGLYYTARVKGVDTYVIPTWDTTIIDTTPYYLEGALVNWSQASAEYSNSNWINSEQNNVLEFSFGGGYRTINSNGQEEPVRPQEIFIDLLVTGEPTFRYLNGIEKQQNSDPGNPFYPSEAILVPSNMEGAYGAFGGIVIEEYVID